MTRSHACRFFTWLRCLALAGALSTFGCLPPAASFLAKAKEENHEHLFHLPGIAGEQRLDRRFVRGLADGGYEGTIEVFDWPKGDAGLNSLFKRARNEKLSDKLAQKIQSMLKEDPDLKIRLVAHSGGAGIAVWALERLPDDVKIEQLVFVAPALSQRYDLSKALAHVRTKAYAFTSVNDVLVLGAGTRVFGTIDGVKEEAAGLRGFTMPEDADEKQYEKLVPMPYVADWMEYDNIGDHIGPMNYTFAKKVISPIVQGQAPAPTTAPTTRPAAAAAN